MRTLTSETAVNRFAGLNVELFGLGKIQITHLLKLGSETAVYETSHPYVVVKIFDLACGKADEISYGAYLRFTFELANFEDIIKTDALRDLVPAYYGANIDYPKQFAWIAMEYLQGEDLLTWCADSANSGFPLAWIPQFKEAIYRTLAVIDAFHRREIILVDFKPENVIRLPQKAIKMVDLGAFFTPRHQVTMEKYLYSATPDYAELLIDASNIETGLPITQASDIFSVGVALFEMVTGASRLSIQDQTADQILHTPEIYRFRDSQLRDLWHEFPHLKELLPLVDTQLRERQILFSEIWHLLKGYLSRQVPGWEDLPAEQKDQILLATGTTFIQEQLPPELHWLAGPIAHATALRSIRAKSVRELMSSFASPVQEPIRTNLQSHNQLVQYAGDLQRPMNLLNDLNTWDVLLQDGKWTLSAPVANTLLGDNAQFVFLIRSAQDDAGNSFYLLAPDDLEATDYHDRKLTLWDLKHDHLAWLC